MYLVGDLQTLEDSNKCLCRKETSKYKELDLLDRLLLLKALCEVRALKSWNLYLFSWIVSCSKKESIMWLIVFSYVCLFISNSPKCLIWYYPTPNSVSFTFYYRWDVILVIELDLRNTIFEEVRIDENHETDQRQAKGPSGEGRRPKWRRTKPPSGEGWRPKWRRMKAQRQRHYQDY